MVGLIVIVGSSVTLVMLVALVTLVMLVMLVALVALVARRAYYPNGIASFSPGLRSVRYPG